MSYLFFETEAELDAATCGLLGESSAEAARKRRHRRRPLRREFTLRDEQGWGPITLECVDISPDGVFLASELLFEPGEGYILEFNSPVSGKTVRVWSRVTRVAEFPQASPEGKVGMAFEFLDLTDDQRRELAAFSH